MSSTSKRHSALDQFDSQRTLLEVLRVISIIIWFVYAFFIDASSNIQFYTFFLIILISLLNTAKLASQSIENKEGSFYSQYVGFLFLYWLFLFIKIKDDYSLQEVFYFGISYESIFHFQKQFLGAALVISSLIFNIISISFIIKSNRETELKYQLYTSQILRGLGLFFLLIVVLTILTWLPEFLDIRVLDLYFVDFFLSLSIICLLIHAIFSSNSQKNRIKTLAKIAMRFSFLILFILYILPNFIELVSGVYYYGNSTTPLNPIWNDMAAFLFILSIVAFYISSSEPEPRIKTNKLRKRVKSSISDINPKKKRNIKKIEFSFSKSKSKQLSIGPYSDAEKIILFGKIIKSSTSNISLERLAKKLSFQGIEDLENWLIDIKLDNLKVDWETSTLIISKELKEEIHKREE